MNILEYIEKCKAPTLYNLDGINYYNLFSLNIEFNLNKLQLKKAYLALQSIIHPDKFTKSNIQVQTTALEWAAFTNTAFNTLNNIAQRALYWCELYTINTNVNLDAALLQKIMTWHELLEDNKYNNEFLNNLQEEVKNVFNDYTDKFNKLSLANNKDILLGKYAKTLLMLEKFLLKI